MREKQSKATQERHERMLNELFKLPGNDRCADCTAKNPRWASYSLGIFLCIRCGSLHRKMGTHISKVKSVSMDRWTLQEIQHMTKLGGNTVINSSINPNPLKHCLPIALDDDHAMERYIRDKWEKKSFVEATSVNSNDIKTGITPPLEDSSMNITSLRQKGDSSTSINTTDMSTPSLSSTNSSLLSSPTMQFAGRVVTETSGSGTNPFIKNNPYNPFATLSSSSNPVTPPSHNPFTQQQQFVQSPFDINYNTSGNSYFNQHNGSNINPGSRHNPFYQ